MRFEWDGDKAASNLAKHGVAFHDAVSIFDDPKIMDQEDPEHSIQEIRRMAIGLSERGILAIAYTIRGNLARIISARFASRQERRRYAVPKR